MHTPVMSLSESHQHAAFTAMRWALSYPGRPQRLLLGGVEAFALLGATLIDLETSYFTPDVTLGARLARTGGRALPPERAAYQFYPQLDEASLHHLAAAPIGTYLEPDLGATMLIGCTLGSGLSLRLTGPGIAGQVNLRVAGIPTQFLDLRAAITYPLGWDLLLIANDQVVGLPRTTLVEVH